MKTSLTQTTIGEICQVFDGPHATPARRDSGPLFLGITSLNKGRIDLSASDHVSEEDFFKWTRRVTPRPGDVVFSYETKLGEAALIPDGLRCCLGRRMGLMRPDPNKLDSRSLLYYYLSPKFQEVIRERTVHGSTVERIALIEFPKFPVYLPPLAEQKRIAHILGTLDDKIELNRRMNATLEAMARALFQSWFVDFDPVRAKLEGRQPEGMDASTAALFPDHFQNSPLGHIPKGWRVAPLHELTSYLSRGIGPSYTIDGGVPVLNQKCIRNHRVDFSQARRHDESKKSVAGRTLKLLDVLINSTGQGTLGRVAQVIEEPKNVIVDSHVTVVRAASTIDACFLGMALLLREIDIESLGEGSTGQTELSKTRLGQLSLVVPRVTLQHAYGTRILPTLQLIATNDQQSRTLTTQRDALLPHLLKN